MQLIKLHQNLRKHFFTNRVIDVWNRLCLIKEVVFADSINILKSLNSEQYDNF